MPRSEEQKRKHRDYMRQYRRRNRERLLPIYKAAHLRWKIRHPERARLVSLKSTKRYQRRHPERKRALNKAWYAAHGAAYMQQWRKKHPEELRAARKRQSLKWRTLHPEISRERARTWQRDNPEKARARSRRWRKVSDKERERCRLKTQHRRKVEGRFSRADIAALYQKQRGACANKRCHKSLDMGYHIDHILPVKRGGTHWPSNLQLTCPRCNLRKGSNLHFSY